MNDAVTGGWNDTHGGEALYRVIEIPTDGDVDLVDFAGFEACLFGPGGGLQPDCSCFDFDSDGDSDLQDFAAFQEAFTG